MFICLLSFVFQIASLWNDEIESVLDNGEVDGLCALNLAVDTYRNGGIKFHLEMRYSEVINYLQCTFVFKICALLVGGNEAYTG